MKTLRYFAVVFLMVVFCDRPAMALQEERVFYFSGTINNKYRIFMRFEYVGGRVRGDYFYESSGRYIRLDGFRDGPDISLVETADGKETGEFAGVFERGVFRGTWTTPDRGKSFPFELVESSAPTADWSLAVSASKDDGKYGCSVTLDVKGGDVTRMQIDVSASYGFAPHVCFFSHDGLQQKVGSTFIELGSSDDPDCRIHITDAGDLFVVHFRSDCRLSCGQNAWFEDLVIFKYESRMSILGLPNR